MSGHQSELAEKKNVYVYHNSCEECHEYYRQGVGLLVLPLTRDILAVSKVSANALNYSACNYYRDEDILSEIEEFEDDVQIQQVETRLVCFRSYYCRHRRISLTIIYLIVSLQ